MTCTGFSISTAGCSYVFCTSEAFILEIKEKSSILERKIVWPLNVASPRPGLGFGPFGGVKQFSCFYFLFPKRCLIFLFYFILTWIPASVSVFRGFTNVVVSSMLVLVLST